MNPTAKIINLEAYLAWYASLTYEQAKELCDTISATMPSYKWSPEKNALEKAFMVSTWVNCPVMETLQYKWNTLNATTTAEYRNFFQFATDYDLNISIGCWVDNSYAYLYIGNPKKGVIILNPEKYLERIEPTDYSNLTPAQLRAQLGVSETSQGDANLVPAEARASLTIAGTKEQLSEREEQLNALRQEIKKVENAETGELAEIKAAIEKMRQELADKKAAMMAELNAKKAEMEVIKERLELQIYLLDSQIYAIECYAGEIVKFAQLRKGKNAPDTEPLVIHQKLRFLDEELGKLASLYTIDWSNMGLFEQFLRESPLALDTFAPNDKCVVLVRLSRTGKILGANTEYANVLDRFDYYHGKTVGIIIRNGENLYLGWTDETRIHIDDDLIVSQVIETQTPDTFDSMSKWEQERYIENQKAERTKVMDGIVSRTFIYNILQGVVDNTDLLSLPAGTKLSEPSDLVVYSVADKWLQDNRFGNFTDIVDRCNKTVNKGDVLLTVQHLTAIEAGSGYGWANHRYGDGKWENPRGRGERNRTHDCSVKDCTLYPANLIEYDEPIEMVHYTAPDGKTDNGWVAQKDGRKLFTGADGKLHMEGLTEGCVVLNEYTARKRHVFVSVEKTDSVYVWSRDRKPDKPARANFEVYEDEFINLSFMNSVWLETVITSKNLGNWRVGNQKVDYAYAIRYLKTAMEHVRNREGNESELILAASGLDNLPANWQVKLSEWKMNKNVRKINEYQAKRFAKTLKEVRK